MTTKTRNKFLAPKRLADGKRGDLRSHCEVFKMTAANETDMKLLSHLYRVMWLTGGKITVEDGNERETYRF